MALDSAEHYYHLYEVQNYDLAAFGDMDALLNMVELLRNSVQEFENDPDLSEQWQQACLDIRMNMLGVVTYLQRIRDHIEGALENPVVEID